MSQQQPDIFDDDDFDKASPNGGGRYALPGFYPKIRIEALKNIKIKDGLAIVVEYEIVESKVPECPPGKGYGYVMKKKHQSFWANVRNAIAQLTGGNFEGVDRLICRAVTGPVQPLENTICSLSAVQVEKKNSAGFYTKHHFGLTTKAPKLVALEKSAAEAAAKAAQQTAV